MANEPAETPRLPAPKDAGRHRTGIGVRGPVVVGIATLLLAFGGFGSWAALAPLSSATVAPGKVTVDGYRKTVQHLEGGIVEEIPVENGTAVDEGAPLLRLDDTRVRATVAQLESQYANALAREARLIAERDGLEEVPRPATLRKIPEKAAIDSVLADAMRGQRNIFVARRQTLTSQVDVLNQRIQQYRQEIAALEAQVESEKRQLELIQVEIEDVQYLFSKGLQRKTRLLALQRAEAKLGGRRGENLALITRTKQSVIGAELEIISLRKQRREKVAKELRRVQARVGDLEERLLAARDRLQHMVVRAPRSGVVVGLNFHTRGGVVKPGEKILDLVPQQSRMVVEAKVRPEDIDTVRSGLPARVRLLAYSQRSTPTVSGTVSMVSADRMREDATGEGHYLARVALDSDSLAALAEAELYPGMPADVMIVTGERTPLEYMMAPLMRTVERGMLEQ